MSYLLDRVLTFSRNTTLAASLPLELQQQVYSLLDCKSFHAARKVCRWWRCASCDPGTLWRQLKSLPVWPPVDGTNTSPETLALLFGEAAHKLMIGMRVNVEQDKPVSYLSACKIPVRPRMTATSCGSKMVTLNDRNIALFDMSGPQPRVLAQRSFVDPKAASGSRPWLRTTPFSCPELALSSDGCLLALAQEHTIQIYDLSNARDSLTIIQNISTTPEHYICGIEFAYDDHTLRVHLIGKGTVLYLGTLPREGMRGRKAGMIHWASEHGLKHTFLDSSLLTLGTEASSEDQSARFSGLQLLQAFDDGYIFAAQKHGGGESSHYVFGHVKCSELPNGVARVVELTSVTELAKLETLLSSWHYDLNSLSETGMASWNNMPSAHEDMPSFALSPDGTVLVLAERDKKRIGSMVQTQLFIYRLPGEGSILTRLEEEEARKIGNSVVLASFLTRSETGDEHGEGVDSPSELGYRIPRIPLSLGSMLGQVKDMHLEEVHIDEGTALNLRVVSTERTKTWKLVDRWI